MGKTSQEVVAEEDYVKQQGGSVFVMIDIKDISHAPSLGEIGTYIGFPLFGEFVQYMDTEYKAIRKIEYSKDVWARGGKQRKGVRGKSTSTLIEGNPGVLSEHKRRQRTEMDDD